MLYSLNKIKSYVSDEIDTLEKQLLLNTRDEFALLENVANLVIKSGGKRIRPMLLIVLAKMLNKFNFEKNYLNIIQTASVIEIIHLASLLHDDVIDSTQTRRGVKTANAVWGNKEVILVGDYLFAKSFDVLSRLSNQSVNTLISGAAMALTRGELMQLETKHNINKPIEKYLDIIYLKTASLFEVSAVSSGVWVGCDDLVRQNLKQFGKSIGLLFQMVDDILDYTGDSASFGKQIGGDFMEGKVTLPVLLAYQNSNQDDKNTLKALFANDVNQQADLEIVLDIIKKTDAQGQCRKLVDFYTTEAKNALFELIKDNKNRDLLVDLIHFLQNRLV